MISPCRTCENRHKDKNTDTCVKCDKRYRFVRQMDHEYMTIPTVKPTIERTPASMRPNPMTHFTATCNVCNQSKPLEDFVKNQNRPGGFDTICKTCKAQKSKQEREKRKAKTTMPDSSESSPQPSTGTGGSRTAPTETTITLTFTPDTQPLYDFLKRYAAQNFRTPENQILWELKCLSESTEIKRQYPFPGNIQPLQLDEYGPDRV